MILSKDGEKSFVKVQNLLRGKRKKYSQQMGNRRKLLQLDF